MFFSNEFKQTRAFLCLWLPCKQYHDSILHDIVQKRLTAIVSSC